MEPPPPQPPPPPPPQYQPPVASPVIIQQAGPERTGPATCVVVFGIIFSALRLILNLGVVILASLALAKAYGATVPIYNVTLVWILVIGGALGIFFEIGVMCGLTSRSRCMAITDLVIFIICLIAFFALAAVIAIAVGKIEEKKKKLEEKKEVLDLTYEAFTIQPSGFNAIQKKMVNGKAVPFPDNVEKEFKCCGIFGDQDYSDEIYDYPDEVKVNVSHLLKLQKRDLVAGFPKSCYPEGKTDEAKVYKTGCQEAILDNSQLLSSAAIIFLAITGVLYLLGAVINSIALCTWK